MFRKKKGYSQVGNGSSTNSDPGEESKASIVFNDNTARKWWGYLAFIAIIGFLVTCLINFLYWYNLVVVDPIWFFSFGVSFAIIFFWVIFGQYFMAHEHKNLAIAAGTTSARLSIFGFQITMNNIHQIAGWGMFYLVCICLLWGLNYDHNNACVTNNDGTHCLQGTITCLDRFTNARPAGVYTGNCYSYADLIVSQKASVTVINAVTALNVSVSLAGTQKEEFYEDWATFTAGMALLVVCQIFAIFLNIVVQYAIFQVTSMLEQKVPNAEGMAIAPAPPLVGNSSGQ